MADSPLSDADSLSSAGASTEPLPGSDPASRISPVKRTSGPSRRNTGGGKGGNESDSSLTEQDSSDNDLDRGDEEDEDENRVRKGGPGNRRKAADRDDEEGEDEDEDMVPTPRAKPSHKRRAIADDEEEDEEEEEGEIRVGNPARKNNNNDVENQFRPAARAIDGNGQNGDLGELSLSEMSGEDEEDEDRGPSGQPPTKRLRRGGPSTNGSIISSSTANGRLSRAGSILSDLDDGTNDLATSRKSQKHGQADDTLEENGSDAVDSDVPVAKKGASGRGRGRGGATKARGSRGGAKRGTGARGGSTSQRHRSLSPSAKSDSPLSVVSSSDGAALAKIVDATRANGETGSSTEGALERQDEDDAEDEIPFPVKGKPGRPALDYATGRSARGRGRGRARYRAPRKSRGGLSAPSISRSDSNGSSSEPPESFNKNNLPLVNGNSNEAPNLPEPSGLVELDTSEPARLANQLHELVEAGEGAIEPLPTNDTSIKETEQKVEEAPHIDEEVVASREEEEEREEVLAEKVEMVDKEEKEEKEEQEEKEETPAVSQKPQQKQQERQQEKQLEKEEKREPVKRVAPASAKKGGKKGGKKGKGKEKAVDQDAIAAEDDELADDSHEEDTSDATFMRKRGEAMEHLTKIEIQFAKLRDMLYVERMTEVEKDRIAIESGSHPELIHLTQLLELRRNKRLELAKAWLDGLESSYDRQYFSDEHAMWNQWQNKRAELRTEMLDEANSKRRRLDREKRALERPKDDTLAAILAPRAPPAVPLHHRRRLGFDGEALVENEIAWALRNPDVRADPSLSGLDDVDAYADLERMGLREPIGHPGMYSYDSIYGPGPGHLSAFADPRTGHLAPGFPYSSYDPAAIAMQSHSYAAAAAAAATPAPFSSLPPLPGRDQPPSRPSSNPRHPNYPSDAGGSQQHIYNAASNRIYPYSNYPDSVAAESMHGQHTSWPGKPAHGANYGFEDERRRTLSAGGTLGATESLDSVAGSRQSGGGANGNDDPMTGVRPIENGGRTTPVGGSNPKPRLTLDDHMSHRSPKATTSATKAADRAGSGRNSPASFMAIPTIPPFDRHRHEMAIAAARANSPHPPHTKPAQPSLYSHPNASDQQGPYAHHASVTSSAAQRAGFM